MIEDVNPFVYSHPVSPEDIIDRDGESEELLRSAVGGHYVRLFAPRKYGKTSLLRRVLRDAGAREGMIPILVDLYGVLSVADVTVRIERAYASQLKGELRTKIERVLQSTGLGLSLGVMGISAKLQIDPRQDPLHALHALLDLPLRLDAGGGFRALIVFDEFQDVAKVAEMDALIRSHIQHQGEVASYVFCGSEPALMRQLFEEKERPLYGQAVPMRLGRLAAADIAAYVLDRFEQTGRSAGEALTPLLGRARGHPQRAMLLAHHLWDEVEPGGAASPEDWTAAYARARLELDAEFDAHWRRFTTTEQKALRSILDGRGSAYRTTVLKSLDLPKPSAQQAVRNLAARAEIEPSEGGGYEIVDPLFADWIERLQDASVGR